MMNTAAPIWDGNETWLVLGGAGLLAAFPKAYAHRAARAYLPVLLMLIALIFRGVAFEFRFKARASRSVLWDIAFSVGSMSPPSPRASSSAPWCRACRSRAATSPAACSTGSRRSRADRRRRWLRLRAAGLRRG